MPAGHVFAALRISSGAGSPSPQRLSTSQSVSAARACNKLKLHCSTTGTKKGKADKPCESVSLVSLAINDKGLILAHSAYQKNIADPRTVGTVLNRMQTNTGKRPDLLTADRGFDQPCKKQRNEK